MNQNHLRKLAGLPLVKESYPEASDFDADMDIVRNNIKSALEIIKSRNWKIHMYDTDIRFSTNAEEMNSDAEDKLQQASNVIENLYKHITSASE